MKRVVWRERCRRTPRRKLPWRSGYLHDSPGRDRKGRNTAWLVKGLQSKATTISSRSKQINKQIKRQQREYRNGHICYAQKNHEKETVVLITLTVRSTVQHSTMKYRSSRNCSSALNSVLYIHTLHAWNIPHVVKPLQCIKLNARIGVCGLGSWQLMSTVEGWQHKSSFSFFFCLVLRHTFNLYVREKEIPPINMIFYVHSSL